jgi:hypothetical protein
LSETSDSQHVRDAKYRKNLDSKVIAILASHTIIFQLNIQKRVAQQR